MSMSNIVYTENTAKRGFEQRFANNGMSLFLSRDNGEINSEIQLGLPLGIIQFYFALEGPLNFHFGPQYSKQLSEGHYYFMYNPQKELDFKIKTDKGVRWVAMYTTIEELHGLFVNSGSQLPFLKGDNANMPLYDEKELSSQVKWTLESLFTADLSPQSLKIFSRGKILEVIALHFDQRSEANAACPFLCDESVRLKIKQAKQELVNRMTAPPSIAQLALEVGISEYKLKSGFKEMYGNTVGGYLLNYKMNSAKTILDQGRKQVSVVAYELGYGSASHFISAFKKKYGITPKKYVQQL